MSFNPSGVLLLKFAAKFKVELKSFLQQGLSEPEFYGL